MSEPQQQNTNATCNSSTDIWDSLSVKLSHDTSMIGALNLAVIEYPQERHTAVDRLKYLISCDRKSAGEYLNYHLENLKGGAFVDVACVLVDIDPVDFGVKIIRGDYNFYREDKKLSIVIEKLARALNKPRNKCTSMEECLLGNYLHRIREKGPYSNTYCEKLSLAMCNEEIRRFLCDIASNNTFPSNIKINNSLRHSAKEILFKGIRYSDVSHYFTSYLRRYDLSVETEKLNMMLDYVSSGPMTWPAANTMVAALGIKAWNRTARSTLLQNSHNLEVVDALMSGLCADRSERLEEVVALLEELKDFPHIKTALFRVALKEYKFFDLSLCGKRADIAATYATRLLAGKA